MTPLPPQRWQDIFPGRTATSIVLHWGRSADQIRAALWGEATTGPWTIADLALVNLADMAAKLLAEAAAEEAARSADQARHAYKGHDGKITWAADWAKLPDLEQAGVIGHKFYPNCYGHTEWIYLGT